MASRQARTIALAAAALCAASAAAAARAAEAPIQNVTLYPGSATVERAIELTPGMTQVEITGLLANFNTDTLRLRADPGIQVGQAVTRDSASLANPSAGAAELEAKIQALQDQLAALDVDIKAAQTAQAYLEHLGGGEGALRPAPPDAKNLLGTLDAIRKGSSEALERVRAGEIRKRALNKQLEVLKSDLGALNSARYASRSVTVAIAARSAGKLWLSYQVNRAGWKPAYRAALDSSASSVDLERMATISQKTGEDWGRVKLKLSTGQPNLSVVAPDPQAWLLNYQAPEERSVLQSQRAPMAPPAPPAPLVSAYARATRNVMEPAPAAQPDYIAPVLENQGQFTTEFEVPTRVSLAADGREISVGLSRQVLPVKQRVRVAPRSSGELAVLTAEAARADGVWLPGQMQLQRDGAYVGALYWNPQANERFQFSFGRDPLVQVKVEHRNEKSGETGLFGRDNQKRIDDRYVLTSTHRQPIEVLVLEATPVSQSDKVSVKTTLSPEPSVRDWEHRRGLVGWERTLKPNETARFDVGYVIDFPKEGAVTGLW